MISPLNGFEYYEIEWRLLGKKGVRGKRRNLSYNWSAFRKWEVAGNFQFSNNKRNLTDICTYNEENLSL